MTQQYVVDVIMGGPSGEASVSRKSGTAIAAALCAQGCDVQIIEITDSLDLSRLRPGAIAFNIVHGTYGEDGQLQQLLDSVGVAYVGSDARASALCMDKTQTKALLKQQHLPVPAGTQVSLKQTFDPRSLKLNTMTGLVLKPAFGGSSLGLHIVASPSFILPAIEQILQDLGPIEILIEERINGPEFTVALIADVSGLRALPPIAIVPYDGDYDFAAKYNRNDTLYRIIGDQKDAALVAELQDLAQRAAQACGCRDIARVDFMQDQHGHLYILEINTLPGFTDHSLVPKAAAAAGIDFADLCMHLVAQAVQRQDVGEYNEK